ncbi:RNA polymerase subunit sigma-24 [Streptomyces sp. WAC06614]|nr:RNA polymerase subunit sigma-24 [Streptomyces sp. WAC06614]
MAGPAGAAVAPVPADGRPAEEPARPGPGAPEPAPVLPEPRPLHEGGLNPTGRLTFDTVDYADVVTPERAYDALHAWAAPALVRQTYLLTGRRRLAQDAVERAFRAAWDRWPEVATDPDPVGWIRAEAYERALSPWHLFRRARRHPDRSPADPDDRILMDALLALPRRHRRAVLLYDGVGLDLPDTAAELEASTPATGARLVRAHAALAARVPGLAAVPPALRSQVLHGRLGALVPAVRLLPRPASSVRRSGEQRAGLWARAAVGLTAAIAVATAYTVATAPTRYVPLVSPGTSVTGVPPHAGPQPLSEEGKELQQKLREDPHPGAARLVPRTE